MPRRLYTNPGASGTMAATLRTPRIEVEVHSQNGYFGPGQTFNVTQDLLAVSTAKSFSPPTGMATLTLTGGITGAPMTSSWLDVLEVMDLVIIRMAPTGDSLMRTVFVGYIQDVSETADVSNPKAIQRAVKVTCGDLLLGLTLPRLSLPPQSISIPGNEFGEPLVQQWLAQYRQVLQSGGTATINNNSMGWLAQYLNMVFGQVESLNLPPTQLIYQMISVLSSILFSPITQLQGPSVSGLARYQDMLNVVMTDTSDFAWQALYNLAPFDNSIWQVCSGAMCNPPFFELFGDVRSDDQVNDLTIPNPAGTNSLSGSVTAGIGSTSGPSMVPYPNNNLTFGPDGAQFYICLRGTPYSQSDWASLSQFGTQTVEAGDVLSYAFSKSRSNVINLYQAYPEAVNQNISSIQARVYPGLADPDSIMQYGLSFQPFPLYGLVNPNASGPDDPNAANFSPDQVSPWEAKLYDWYWFNPKFLSGTITVKGDSRYRIGQRFYAPWWPLEGYIEGVSHSFTVMGEFRTSLTISRVCKPGAQFQQANTYPLLIATNPGTGT